MSTEGYSLLELEQELEELRKDHAAFQAAYDTLCKRIIASNEVQPPRQPELHTWSGSRAVIGSLEMSIHAIERTIIEYGTLINRVKSGELPNTDIPQRPMLSLVKESE